MRKPLQIATNFVAMGAEFQTDTVPVTVNLYVELDQAGEGTENREQPVRGDDD